MPDEGKMPSDNYSPEIRYRSEALPGNELRCGQESEYGIPRNSYKVSCQERTDST